MRTPVKVGEVFDDLLGSAKQPMALQDAGDVDAEIEPGQEQAI